MNNTSAMVRNLDQPASQQSMAVANAPTQQAVTQAPLPVNAQPPGTEVTPLEGMQQMGLTPDPDAGSHPGRRQRQFIVIAERSRHRDWL